MKTIYILHDKSTSYVWKLFYWHWFWGWNQFCLTLFWDGNQFWLKLILRRILYFSDQFFLKKGRNKLKTYKKLTTLAKWYICTLCVKTSHVLPDSVLQFFLPKLSLRLKSVLSKTDFEMEISFDWNWFWEGNYTIVISFCWQRVTTNWKLRKIEQNMLHDKFAQFVWKLAVLYMINLHIMYVFFTGTYFEDEISFHWKWFWSKTDFEMEISCDWNWFWGGNYTIVTSFCWKRLTTNWKLPKCTTICYMIKLHNLCEN